jgi:hypothetical protein
MPRRERPRRRARDESDDDNDGEEESLVERKEKQPRGSRSKREADDDKGKPARRSRSKRGGDSTAGEDDDEGKPARLSRSKRGGDSTAGEEEKSDDDDDDSDNGAQSKRNKEKSSQKNNKGSGDDSGTDQEKPGARSTGRPNMATLAAGKNSNLDAGRPFGNQIPAVWNATWQSIQRKTGAHTDFLEAGRESMLQAEGALFRLRDDDDQSTMFWKRLTQGSTAVQFIFGILALQVLCIFQRSCAKNSEDPSVPENADMVPEVTLVLMLVVAPLGYMGAAARSKLALALHALLALLAVVCLLAVTIIAFKSAKNGSQISALQDEVAWSAREVRVKMSYDWNGVKDNAASDLRRNLESIGGMAVAAMLLNLFSMVGALSLLATAPGSLVAEVGDTFPFCRRKTARAGGSHGAIMRCWRATRGRVV